MSDPTWGQRALLQLLPCTHVARVQHEDAARGFRLVHDWTEGDVLLVQGDLQGLAAAAEEEEGAQEPHALHEHFLGEGGDALLRGKDDLQLTDFFGLQRDVVEWYQGDDLGKVTTGLSAEGRGSAVSVLGGPAAGAVTAQGSNLTPALSYQLSPLTSYLNLLRHIQTIGVKCVGHRGHSVDGNSFSNPLQTPLLWWRNKQEEIKTLSPLGFPEERAQAPCVALPSERLQGRFLGPAPGQPDQCPCRGLEPAFSEVPWVTLF